VLFCAGCARGTFVLVTVSSVPVNVDHLSVVVTNNNQASVAHDFAIAKTVNGAFDFSLSFASDRHGPVLVQVAALAGSVTIARGEATGTITPGGTTSLSIDLSGGVVDMGAPPDLPAVLDLRAAPIVPSAISGLQLWVRSDQGISASDGGAGVSVWSDQSGTHHDTFQANPAMQPEYVANVVNGLPAVRFTGTQYLSFDGALVVNTNYTAFVVEAPSEAPAGNTPNPVIAGPPQGIGLTGDTTFIIVYTANNNTPLLRFTQWFNDLDVDVAPWVGPDHFNVDSVVFDQTIGHTAYVLNGLQSSNGYKNPIKENAAAAIGGNTSFWKSYRGDIAEVIIYNVALDDLERRGVELYLRNRYGL
jgi:hypothetical protein